MARLDKKALASFGAGLPIGSFLLGGDLAELVGASWGAGVVLALLVAAALWLLLSRRLAGWRNAAAASGAVVAFLATAAWVAYSIASCRTCT